MLTISSDDPFGAQELKALFASVGWAVDLSPEMLWNAMRNSSHYVTARLDGALVGIVRSMDDGIWSANIDCMVVHSAFQRRGIADAMLKKLLEVLGQIKYISVSPDSAYVLPLYQKNGFALIEGGVLLQRNQWQEEG